VAFGVNAQINRSVQPKPGPSPKIDLQAPKEFTLGNGLKVMVVENHKLPRVSYTLNIDNKPTVDGKIAGISEILAAMLGNGTTSVPKDDFNEEVDFLGASISFSSSGGYGRSLSKYAERIMELMADATINPLLVEEEFQKQRDRLLDGIKSSAKSVDAVAQRVGNALTYGTHHPYGEFMTEETVNNITYGDVYAYYQKRFNPDNAYLVIVGDVSVNEMKKQVEKYFGPWKRSIAVDYTVPAPIPNVNMTQINFVDMPNAVQSDVNLTHNVELKMTNPDYHAVLIANKILGGGFNSYLNMNLREEHGYTYGARSNIDADKYIGQFSASTAVRNMVTDSTVVNILKEINRIKTEPVSDEALKNAKSKYVGDFVLALENPQTIARYALNIKLNGLPKNFYETYLQKINAVTAKDVQRVANKYFKNENARIIVVGKGSDVIENLEKTNIPIFYFDTYANPVEKPVFSRPIPEGVTAQSVVDKYLTAIGGKDQAITVNSVQYLADVTIEGLPLPLKADIRHMAPNKESMEMSAEGMGVIMKQKFDGTAGYMEQQGMKIDLKEDEIADKKSEHVIFPELHYEPSALSLEALTNVDGKDAYKIKVKKGGNDSFRYYDAQSGYLIRVESTTEMQGQTITSVIDFDGYASAGALQLPYNETVKSGPQTITLTIKEININKNVSDSDFK